MQCERDGRMTQFVPGDLGFVAVRLHGGPLDGQCYEDIPVMPDGLPGSGLSIPLGAVSAETDFANYTRPSDEAESGMWTFEFTGIKLHEQSEGSDPTGESHGGFAHVGPLKPIRVSVEDRADHPLLRFSRLLQDEKGTWHLEWPSFNSEQRESVAKITMQKSDAEIVLSIPPRVNLDFLADDNTDETAPPFWTGRAPDLQRFYTRFTDTQFLHVGTYSAITIDGVRRYFAWRDKGWVGISLSSFLYVRDDGETHFAETNKDDLESVSPGAAAYEPVWAVSNVVEQIHEDEDDLMTEVDAMVQHGLAAGIASIAHRGQVDKLGYDYIDHPARVSEVFDWLDEPVAHCAAWLHDVIKDSDISAKDLLAAGMLPEVVQVVELLTRTDTVASQDYYELIRQHPVARAVKLADIADNMADWRFRKLDYEMQIRLSQKYFEARRILTAEDA